MRFSRLVEIVDDEPVFDTGVLLSGNVDPPDVRRQLSRWASNGRLHRLRRDLYALAPPYQKVKPHPFAIANRMVRASYVSLQSALAHYGLIPEYVPVTTSVTTGERRRWDTPLGSYEFRQIKGELFRGYQMVELAGRQRAFVATPEKALLDLVYLTPGADSTDYLVELRLQRLDRLDLETLQSEAELFNKPKLRRAAARVADLVRAESSEYETV